jgi:ActR/RegA family two-component response regulator
VDHRTESHRRVLLYALPLEFAGAISSEAQQMGCETFGIPSVDELNRMCRQVHAELAIINADVCQAHNAISTCRSEMVSSSKIVAITDVPSLLRAGSFVRHGASFVLARPTTFRQIVAVCDDRPLQDEVPMSLDRAIWEYLNQTLAETGSISAAARRLRLDRTSLKRMLRKRPPSC